MRQSILKEKSFQFAVRMINLNKYLRQEHKEYVLSQQMIRCGTSIGAIIREAEHAESRRDFIHKLAIVLKEANECKYWLDLLVETNFITRNMYLSLVKDCEELLKMLTSSVKTTKLRT